MDALPDIVTGARAPASDVLPLEFSFLLRPKCRLMLLGQVPCLDAFRALSPDVRVWLRWLEPDRADAEIEIAWASGEEPASGARVLARGAVLDRWGGWGLFRVAQAQGWVDVLLAGTGAPAGAPEEFLHLLVSVAPAEPHSELVPRLRSASPAPSTLSSLAA